ncbi:MAG: alkaline phosphatase [Actinobacteria bacterium]|nr:alkaline phosphatase [Actinomycetota bacterium]
MKVLLLVMDGLADMSHPELAWSTPLQAAATPALDRLAQEGCCALMYPLRPGVCPSSEVAHWSMFGYRPGEFPGRACFHALAAGLPIESSDALFMLNLVPLEVKREGTFVLDESGAPIEDICATWAARLCELAPGGMRLFYMGGMEFIAVVGGGSHHLLPTDPFIHHFPVEELRPAGGWEDDGATAATERALTAFIHAAEVMLERENAWDGGALGFTMKWPSLAMDVEPFGRRHGMRPAAVVSTPCFQGMGEVLSMQVKTVGAKDAGRDLEMKLEAASALLREGFEFVFVHTKHADEAAHAGDPAAKAEVIAAMDLALSSAATSWDDPELLLVVTADHSTPTALDRRVIHGGDPVPVLFHGRTVRRDGLQGFDEVSAARGGMGQITGGDLMPVISYLSRRARFYTA